VDVDADDDEDEDRAIAARLHEDVVIVTLL
jgi:hypothetical protein